MRLFTIESKSIYDPPHSKDRFRFRSLYNGAVGSWCKKKEDAIKYGRKHQHIINRMKRMERRS